MRRDLDIEDDIKRVDELIEGLPATAIERKAELYKAKAELHKAQAMFCFVDEFSNKWFT